MARFVAYKYGVEGRGSTPYGVRVATLAMTHIMAVLNVTSPFVGLRFSKRRNRLCAVLGTYKAEYSPNWNPRFEKKVNKLVVISWAVSVSDIVILIIFYFQVDAAAEFTYETLTIGVSTKTSASDIIFLLYNIFYTFTSTCNLFLTVGLFYLFFGDATSEFREFNQDFRKAVSKCSTTDLPRVLHGYRWRHLLLCKIIRLLDNIFSPIVLSVFCCGIAVICLNLYINICYPPMGTLYWIVMVVPVTSGFVGLMILLSKVGTNLSDAVRIHILHVGLLSIVDNLGHLPNDHNNISKTIS